MDNTDVREHIRVYKKPVYKEIPGKSDTAGNIIISKLQPLRFALVKGLSSLGISTHGLNFKTIVILYYNKYCVNRLNIKPVDINTFVNNPAFKLRTDELPTANLNDVRNRVAFTEISEVVENIINVFKASKIRYETLTKQGFIAEDMMSDAEFQQARATVYVENKLLRKFRHDNFGGAGDNDWLSWIVIFAMIGFILSEG